MSFLLALTNLQKKDEHGIDQKNTTIFHDFHGQFLLRKIVLGNFPVVSTYQMTQKIQKPTNFSIMCLVEMVEVKFSQNLDFMVYISYISLYISYIS